MARARPMTIVSLEMDTDLRTISARRKFLRKVARGYKLKNRQSVCYVNKAMSRFRLVTNLEGAVFLIMPEIDEGAKLSVFLEISRTLTRLSRGRPIQSKFGDLHENTKIRIARRKELAKKRAAKKKGAKKATKKKGTRKR